MSFQAQSLMLFVQGTQSVSWKASTLLLLFLQWPMTFVLASVCWTYFYVIPNLTFTFEIDFLFSILSFKKWMFKFIFQSIVWKHYSKPITSKEGYWPLTTLALSRLTFQICWTSMSLHNPYIVPFEKEKQNQLFVDPCPGGCG